MIILRFLPESKIHRELLNLPDHVIPACMLCFGYPTQQQKDRKKPPRFALSDIVYEKSGIRLEPEVRIW